MLSRIFLHSQSIFSNGTRRFFTTQQGNNIRLAGVKDPEVTPEKIEQIKKEKEIIRKLNTDWYQSPLRTSKIVANLANEGIAPAPKTTLQIKKKILNTNNINALLNVTEHSRFYMTPGQLLFSLSKYLQLMPNHKKEKKRILLAASRSKTKGGAPKLPKYDVTEDSRIASVIQRLENNRHQLSQHERVLALWLLAKGAKYFHSERAIMKIFTDLIEGDLNEEQRGPQGLAALNEKELGQVMWSLGKGVINSKLFLGKIAIEYEKRIKSLLERRMPLFLTEEQELDRRKKRKRSAEEPTEKDQKQELSEEDDEQNEESLYDLEPEDYDDLTPPDEVARVSMDEVHPFPKQSLLIYFWSLHRLGAYDHEFTDSILYRIYEEKIINNLNLQELTMIMPTIIDTDFNGKQILVSQIYERLHHLKSHFTPNHRPPASSLTLKILLVHLSSFSSIQQDQDLFLFYTGKFFHGVEVDSSPDETRTEREVRLEKRLKEIEWGEEIIDGGVEVGVEGPEGVEGVEEKRKKGPLKVYKQIPSPRFVSEIIWALGKSKVNSLPPSLCRKIELSISARIDKYTVRDLVSILYTLGRFVERKKNGEPVQLGLDLNTLVKLITNELTIKKLKIDPKSRNMIEQYTPLLSRHCSTLKYLFK